MCCVVVVLQLEDIGARVFFEKQLTSSDVSASGRVVVPKVRLQRADLDGRVYGGVQQHGKA